MGLLRNIIDDNQITTDDLPRIEDKLFFEGKRRRLNLESFAVLMFFATLIASYGIIADSTATVIGAMIVAPLMTPIMATAAALVMGRMDRAAQALLIVIGGVIGAIFLSWLVGVTFIIGIINVNTNAQILSRTSPSLVDLAAALASGGAGAFAISRKDISDTLPGVAIAIALVPPLAVVGLTLSQGAYDDAWGAFLLFATNFLSILLAGGGVLALLGLGQAATADLDARRRRNAFYAIALGAMLVTVPLAATSYNTAQAGYAQFQATRSSQEWLQDSGYEVARVDAPSSDYVLIRVTGDGDLPPRDELTASLQERFGRDVTVRLQVIPARNDEWVVSAPD